MNGAAGAVAAIDDRRTRRAGGICAATRSKAAVRREGNCVSNEAARLLPRIQLENDDIALHVSGKSGAIDSLRWKNKNISLVDEHAAAGWGEYLYIPGTDPAKAQRLSDVHVRVKENGPLVVSLLIEGEAPGAKKYSSEVRLVAGLNRVDILTKFDKLAVREKESIHFAFPFRVPGGRCDTTWRTESCVRQQDQLAGACKNFFSASELDGCFKQRLRRDARGAGCAARSKWARLQRSSRGCGRFSLRP